MLKQQDLILIGVHKSVPYL